MTIIDQLMSTVTIQQIITEVPNQLICSRVSRSAEWTDVYVNDEPKYSHWWSRQPSTIPHALPSEHCSCQWSPKVFGWEYWCDYSCYWMNRPLQCHLLGNYYPTSVKWCYSYFDLFSLTTAKYANEEILNIHLTADEPTWDPSTSEYSGERLKC